VFDRGFKAWCERYSISKRTELGIAPHAPLNAYKLADNLGVRVWTPSDVPGLSQKSVDVLLFNDNKTPSCWSAVTLVVGKKIVVILNSSHSQGRRASDLTHELAHIILDHKTHETNVTKEGVMLLATYEKKQEDEADWLSSSLLLPRDALVSIRKNGSPLEDNAKTYGVSLKMLKYRMAMSGVNRQFGLM
jgi:Zn-dependent peptidase ImmA (M78 family)